MKLISANGETQSQLHKPIGETQRKENRVEIEHFYVFTGHFPSSFCLKHR